ncbi:hypothetical protein ACIOUE_04495 [Streptomyces xanthochromogenes]|uniref:hypothetical protein n=1 Tax=Streptomyces TaxID=1883 RepID=UPI001F3961DD|nr:hypothetical protein [Streptomyces sp. SID1034]
MPTQDRSPDAPFLDADAAASALRDVEAARTRVELRARLVPSWYGPSAAALLAAYGIGTGAANSHGINGIWGWAGLLAVLLGLGLARLRKRATGVLVGRSPARKRAVALSVAAALALVWGVCLSLGLGVPVTLGVAGVVLGLGVWAHSARQNTTVTRKLREGV